MVKRSQSTNKHLSAKKQRKNQLQLLRAEIFKDEVESLPAWSQSSQTLVLADSKNIIINENQYKKSKLKPYQAIDVCHNDGVILEASELDVKNRQEDNKKYEKDPNNVNKSLDEMNDSETYSNGSNCNVSTITFNENNNIAQGTMLKPIEFKVKRAFVPDTTFEVKVFNDDSRITIASLFCSLADYGVSEVTLKPLSDNGYNNMTKFQSQSLPALLQGRDLFSTATVKNGKLLAYFIPGLEILQKLHFERQHGTGVIILLPTQELIWEYCSFIKAVSTAHNFTCSYIMGVNSKEVEESELREGANIVVATPGHLLHHIHNSSTFKYVNFQYLVIDGALHMLNLGLEYELKRLSKVLPKHRQTVMISAVQTQKTMELAGYCLKKTPFYVCGESFKQNIDQTRELAIEYMVCPPEKRLLFLITLLQSNRNRKVVVLVSSCSSAQFHNNILNYKGIPCVCFHGKQKIEQRRLALSKFLNSKNQVLVCANISALENNISNVDLCIQYDPPDDIEYYLAKHGQVVGDGNALVKTLLLLRPEETGFVTYLHELNIKTKLIEYPVTSVLNIQDEIEGDLKTMYFLHVSSRDAYQAFIRAYSSHVLPSVFDVKKLDLVKVALSFGFSVPPYVNFNVHNKQFGKIAHKIKDKSMKVDVLFKPVSQVKKMKKKEIFVSYKS